MTDRRKQIQIEHYRLGLEIDLAMADTNAASAKMRLFDDHGHENYVEAAEAFDAALRRMHELIEERQALQDEDRRLRGGS